MTRHSGFLLLVTDGDQIMADKGFLIQDLLETKKSYLDNPTIVVKSKVLIVQH